MILFQTLLIKIIPLYAFILLGYIAGRFFHVKKESIANLVIYIIAPIIFFNAAATTPLTISNISFPILCFSFCFIMAGLFYLIGKLVFNDNRKNILSYTCAMGNIGYFGLPVALVLLPKAVVNIYLLGVLGMNVFDASIAYFIVAHGTHTITDSIKRVFVLPTLYTFFLGVLVQLIHLPLGLVYMDAITNVRGVYVVLGMMLVGLALASLKDFSIDIPFLLITFLAKFLVWPMGVSLFIFTDSTFFHFFTMGIHQALFLLSIVPVAANSVAYSSQFNLHPEKAAVVVIGSTLLAIVYIPLVVSLFFH